MSNSFKVIDMITKEATRLVHEKAAFLGTVDRQYDDSFKDNGRGRIGAVLRIRRPNQYMVRTGQVMDVQDQAELSDSFTLATMKGVDMKFNHTELLQSVNSDAAFDDFSSKYIEPAVNVLVSTIESDFLAYATKLTYNTAGTAGTAISTLETPGKARAKLNQYLAPKDMQRYVQMDSVAMATLVSGVAAYFNPGADIAKQYREGMVSRTGMADWYENERIWTMSNGDDVAGAIDESAETNFVQGATVLHMDALGTTVKEGQVFTITGVYACHPETKSAYPHLQQFAVVGTPTVGSNEADITFTPAIYTTGARKNVCTATGADITWSVAGQNDVVVNFVGAVNTAYQCGLMYHKEAFQFATADLPIMDDAHKCMRKNKDGISLRVWQGSDIVNGELLMRLDILYGMAALNPQFACRMIGAANT